MAYKLTDATGFVASGGLMALPKVSITGEAGGKLGTYARASSVLWRRNSAFSTADVEVVDARISDAIRLGSATGIDVGSSIKIKVDDVLIFQGYIMRQNLTASQGTGKTKNERITLKCVDYKFDLYREVIFGQIGVQSDGSTGKEASDGGLYGGGCGWFSGLRTVFNDRTFAKNQESAVSKSTLGTEVYGNGRTTPAGAFASAGTAKPRLVFDGDYYALSKEEGDLADIKSKRNLPWSAWDMLTYVIAFCYEPPWGKVGVLPGEAVLPEVVASTRIILGDKNDMEKVFPVNVDITGLRGTDAITKICSAAGFNWWLEPPDTSGASKIVVWRTGDPGPKSLEFFMGGGGSGVARPPGGLYRLLDAPLTYPLVDVEKWNVDDISVDLDYTTMVGTIIGTTQRIRVQNIFPLVKGWANTKWFTFVTKAALDGTTKKLEDSGQNREPHVFPFKSAKDGEGKTIRFFVKGVTGGVQIHLDRDGSSEDAFEDDSIAAVFRRWITDETGRIKTSNDEERDPYKFFVSGLVEEGGSGYMVKPRPFLSQNILSSLDGERRPPQIGFPKYTPAQAGESTSVDILGGDKKNPRDGETRDRKKIFHGEKEYYPFGVKRGQFRILRDTSGMYIEGGYLDLMNITFDPEKNKITILPPICLGSVEHDQAKLALAIYFAGVGKLAPARRWMDGKRFVVDRIYATEFNKSPSPLQISEGAEGANVAKGTAAIVKEIDESGKLKTELDKEDGFYKAPKVTMRARIPTITKAYLLGDKITGISGRLTLTSAELPANSIVGVQFNLTSMNTTISVESEVLNAQGLKVLNRSE
jgi:hypothetical protein